MKKEPKLFKIIRTLNVKYFGRVKKLLKSPFFTQNKNLLPLFNYLIQFYPMLDSAQLDKRIVFRKVYGSKPFSDSKYTNLCFECARLIEEFLIIKKGEEDEFYRNSELSDIYFDKLGGERHSNSLSLLKNTEDKLERFIGKLPKPEFSEANEEYQKFLFYEKKLRQIDFKKLNERIIIYNSSLAAIENFYQIKKAILSVERLNLIGYLGVQATPDPPQEYLQNLYFKIFSFLKKMISEEDFGAYLKAKKAAFENVEMFPDDIIDDIFQLLKNFLIRRQHIDAKLYTSELVRFYSQIVENEFLAKGNLFRPLDYINTILVLAPIDLNKAIEFHMKYKSFLPQKEILDAEQLTTAHILYHQKKLRESFAKVSTHKFSIHMTEMMARAHELRCGYEIFEKDFNFGEFYQDKLINIGKQYKRSKLPAGKRIAAENLVKVLKRLVKRDLNKDFTQETQEKLIADISGMKHLTSREWLRKKITRQS